MAEKIHITQSKLEQIWESTDTDLPEFGKYFELDNSSPFAPKLQLKQNVVVIADQEDRHEALGVGEDIVLGFLNSQSRKNRKKDYEKFVLKHPGFPRIVSEGDSWFQHPMIKDTIDHLSKYYPVYSTGAAGDTLRGMHESGDWMESIEEIQPRIFLLSGGGNDILGNEFPTFLNPYSDGVPSQTPERFLNDIFHKEIESLKQIYQDICEQIADRYPGLPMIGHGYDHVIPNNKNVPQKWYQSSDKSWVGKYMLENKIEDPRDQSALITYIIGLFNKMLAELAETYSHVHIIDLRGTIRDDQWSDEIHPTETGYQQIELKFLKKIRSIIN